MDKLFKWGATFSVNMMCHNNKGILTMPIYSYIDNKQKIKIEQINISKYNDIEIKFSYEPWANKSENISFNIIENADRRHVDTREQEGFRENYNERYD